MITGDRDSDYSSLAMNISSCDSFRLRKPPICPHLAVRAFSHRITKGRSSPSIDNNGFAQETTPLSPSGFNAANGAIRAT